MFTQYFEFISETKWYNKTSGSIWINDNNFLFKHMVSVAQDSQPILEIFNMGELCS